MMLGSSEMLVVLGVIVLLFGGSQIPKLARNLGKAQSEFKRGLDEARSSDADGADADTDENVTVPPAD